MAENVVQEPETESRFSLHAYLYILWAVILGLYLAMTLFPTWLPNLSASLVGANPKGYWYLSRGSGFVAMTLLWASMAFGVGISNKMTRLWPGAPTGFAVHEFVSLLGFGFALFHALILMGDRYIKYTLPQVLIPFTATGYKPLWVGIGQVAFYTFAIVTFTFYVRSHLGHKAWRTIHYVSFLTYLAALAHALMSGTDTSNAWALWYYWISASSLLFLVMYRVVARLAAPRPPARVAVERRNPSP
jgi:predicted ferric reductase